MFRPISTRIILVLLGGGRLILREPPRDPDVPTTVALTARQEKGIAKALDWFGYNCPAVRDFSVCGPDGDTSIRVWCGPKEDPEAWNNRQIYRVTFQGETVTVRPWRGDPEVCP